MTLDDIETLPVNVTYVGETRRDDWVCDEWRVALTGKAGYWSTSYYTGEGLRREVKGARAMGVKTTKTVGNKWVAAEPVKPKIADVIYSLMMDASAADYNFSDWCAEYGYSDDSIKALNTYKDCLSIGVALRKYLSPDVVRDARELLKDY